MTAVLAGQIILSDHNNALDTLLADVDSAWNSYAVAWTSGGVAPAISNGTLEGKYTQVGKLVIARIRVVMGSTTTFGTGQYFFSLPVNALVSNQPGSCYLLDTGTANKSATASITTGLGTVFMIQNTTDVAATAPHTWANGDRIDIVIIYEAA